MAYPDDKGQAELSADTDDEVRIRVNGGYLTQALRACGGMVELKLTNSYSPMLILLKSLQAIKPLTYLLRIAYLLAIFYSGGRDASLLYEMQDKKGNEKSTADYNEERQTGEYWCLPRMWDKDVQDW